MRRQSCDFVVRIWHKTHFLMARLIFFAFKQKNIYTWIRRAADMQQFIWFSFKNEPHHDKPDFAICDQQRRRSGFLVTRLEYDLFYFYGVLLVSLSAALRYRFRRSFNPNNHNIDNKQKLCQGQYLIIAEPLRINILCLKKSQRRENFPQ